MPMDLRGIDEESTVRIERGRRISSEELFRFCGANPDWQIEQTSEGEIIIMPPAGWESSHRNLAVSARLFDWAERGGRGQASDSSGGFQLPNGAMRAPGAAWISNIRLDTVAEDQKRVFIPLCPEFVVEVQSPSDSLPQLTRKMREWIENGAELGWLIQPDERTIHIYRPGRNPEMRASVSDIEGEGPVAGFVLGLKPVWKRL